MSTEFPMKMLSVMVVLVVCCGALIPAVSAVTSTTTEVTETHTFGTNSLEGYSDTYASYRSDSAGTADEDGDHVSMPLTALKNLTANLGMGDTFTLYYGQTSQTYTVTGAQTIDYNGNLIAVTVNDNNPSIADITCTSATADADDIKVVFPYDVTYTLETQMTYGTNSIHSLVLTDVVGDITLSSGTSYAFTANAGGDWLQIPAHILRDTTQTYKVLDGSYIYVPDSSSTYAQYTIDGTSISVTGMTLTFTQDTSITSATVYNMTATVTDIDLPGVVIEHVVEDISTTPFSVSKIVGDNEILFLLTTSGDLFSTNSYNTFGGGLGTNTYVDSWVKVASNVKDVATNGELSIYVATDGSAYGVGYAKEPWGQGYSNWTLKTTWTNLGVSDIQDVEMGTNDTYLIDGSGKLIVAGSNSYGVLGDGTASAVDTFTILSLSFTPKKIIPLGVNAYLIDTNDNLYFTGYNYNGLLGDGSQTNVTSWTATSLTNVESVFVDPQTSAKAYAIDSSGNLYYTGAANLTGATATAYTWSLVATDVVTASASQYSANVCDMYVSTNGDVYYVGWTNRMWGGSSSTTYATWTQVATGDFAVGGQIASLGRPIAYVIDDGTLYVTGDDRYGILGTGSSATLYNLTSTGLTDITDVKLHKIVATTPSAYAFDTSHHVYTTGTNNGVGNGHDVVSNSWKLIGVVETTTIYTNPTETETVSDQRGTVTNNVFTPSASGDYLYIPIEDAVTYTYYVSVGSTVYAPNTAGTALAPHVVPDTTGIDPAVTITLTQVTGYNDQIYGVTATTTDSDIVGWAIPYTVTYTKQEDVHFAYNDVGNVTVTWTPVRGNVSSTGFVAAADGAWLKVWSQNLENTVYHIGEGGGYVVDNNGTYTAYIVPQDPPQDASLTLTVNTTDSHVYDISGSTDGDSVTVIIPYEATYTTTETERVSTVPMAEILIMIMIVLMIVMVLGLLKWKEVL